MDSSLKNSGHHENGAIALHDSCQGTHLLTRITGKTKSNKRRKVLSMKKLLASASAITLITIMSVVIPPASQATQPATLITASIQPYQAQGCITDTCMFLSSPASGTVYVQGWAYSTTFYGYFRLTSPSGTLYSATQTWIGGKGNYTQWSDIPAIVGQYCVTGFTSAGVNEGTVCKNVQ